MRVIHHAPAEGNHKTGEQCCTRCGHVLVDNGPNVASIAPWDPSWWPEGPVTQLGSHYERGARKSIPLCSKERQP